MACCCGQVFTCGSCSAIPSDISVEITSSGGNPLSNVGCIYGDTSFVVSRPNGWYFPSSCLTCAGDGTANNFWTTGNTLTTLIAEPNGACTPFTPPYYVAQGVLQCLAGSFRLDWYCGAYTVSTSCGDAYRNPLPPGFGAQSNPLTLTGGITCNPFSATLTATFNGYTFTATLSPVSFP